MANWIAPCGTHSNSESNKKLEKYIHDMSTASRTKSTLAAPPPILTLRLVYVVIPFGHTWETGDVPDACIQAQHQLLNTHYLSFQRNDLMVPGLPHYQYSHLFDDPRIQFSPTDVSKIVTGSPNIERMQIPKTLPHNGYETFAAVEEEYRAQGGVQKPGHLYVFITSLYTSPSNMLLGESRSIVSNACAVHFGTVGSVEKAGAFSVLGNPMFSAGKTLIHEIGHCLGLYHPFESGGSNSCAGAVYYNATFNPQSPLQYQPNLGNQCFLSEMASGNAFDNRGRDLLRQLSPSCASSTPGSDCGLKLQDVARSETTPPYSCAGFLNLDLTSETTPHETFFLFMDYADDQNRIGFFSFHTRLMRAVILNNPDLFDLTDSVTMSIHVTPIPVTPVSAATETTPLTDASFPFWAIIVIIVVVSVLILALSIFLMVRKIQFKKWKKFESK